MYYIGCPIHLSVLMDSTYVQNVVLLVHFFSGIILMVISFIMGVIQTTASANSFLKVKNCLFNLYISHFINFIFISQKSPSVEDFNFEKLYILSYLCLKLKEHLVWNLFLLNFLTIIYWPSSVYCIIRQLLKFFYSVIPKRM